MTREQLEARLKVLAVNRRELWAMVWGQDYDDVDRRLFMQRILTGLEEEARLVHVAASLPPQDRQ